MRNHTSAQCLKIGGKGGADKPKGGAHTAASGDGATPS